MSTFVIILIMVGFFAGSVYWGMSRWRQSRSASPSMEAFLAQHQAAAGMLPVAQAQPQLQQPPLPPQAAVGPVADEPDIWPFAEKPRVIDAPQQVLYFRLRNALPDHVVLGAVSLAQFLAVARAADVAAWGRRIADLHVDFLVCTKAGRVALAIDIETGVAASADSERRKQKALSAAGIQLLRVQATALPAESAIAALVKSLAGSRPP